MLLASRLQKGDTIAFFSPSSPVTATAPKRFDRARQFITAQGFRLLEGSLTGKQDFYRSGTIAQRADELNALIRNPDVRCIISTIGGMNSNSLLPYIDYAQLIKTPKVLIGYSDVTALLLGIYAKTGLVTFYGPALVASFGEFSPHVDETFRLFKSLLIEETSVPFVLPAVSFWSDEFIPWEEQTRAKTQIKNKLVTVCPGVVKGRLIGGNLNTMQGIWGSPYMPKIQEGDILFLEDSLCDIATIERSFALLKLSGVFDKISGLILGKHELFDDGGTGRTPYEVLLEILGTPSFPILAEFDCAHTHPMLTLPIGCQAILDADEQRVTLTEPWIR